MAPEYDELPGAVSPSYMAHSVIVSDRVFSARCAWKGERWVRPVRKDESGIMASYRIEGCYKRSGEAIAGFLCRTNSKYRPEWEGNSVPKGLLWSEARITKSLMKGSEEFGFPGIGEGDNVLVRAVGDNRGKGRGTVTYFFEAAVTIRKPDEAVWMNTGEMAVTAVKDMWGDVKTEVYRKGDFVCCLPILTTTTGRSGEVGVGYVAMDRRETGERREAGNDSPFCLKRVLVRGGAGYVGRLVKEAKILDIGKEIEADCDW
jgi:hypothetical protein